MQYMKDLELFGIKLGLRNIETLLELLGKPHEEFKSVHVAGTNGKGSVCAMVEAVLREAGYKTGLYTSPHLVDFCERVKVNGKQITHKELASYISEVKVHADRMVKMPESTHPTFFEVTTAAAFHYFAEREIDIGVIETGLGGRLDATNVLDPEVTAITTIGIEHSSVLGSDIETIAKEKAGIIKKATVVTSASGEALQVVKATAKERGAPVHALGEDIMYERGDPMNRQGMQVLDVLTPRERYASVELGLLGPHQAMNAAVAVGILDALADKGFEIPEKLMRNGLAEVSWSARFEIVQKDPFIVLDCAHNPSGFKQLGVTLEESFPDKNIKILIGVLDDKDAKGIGDIIFPGADKIYVTKPNSERAMDARLLFKLASRHCSDVEVISDVPTAYKIASSSLSQNDVLVVTGSLYTLGEVIPLLKK
jgi:dihydrofolate synthase/folylpolyglutamate synthase